MRIKVTEENLGKLSHKEQVKFSLFCAKQVEYLITAKEAKNCIEVIERWLRDEASQEECREATAAADDAAVASTIIHAAAAYAADVAARAARETAYAADVAARAVFAATYAAYAATYATFATEESNKAKITKEQEEYLYELINIDSIVEKNLLT